MSVKVQSSHVRDGVDVFLLQGGEEKEVVGLEGTFQIFSQWNGA